MSLPWQWEIKYRRQLPGLTAQLSPLSFRTAPHTSALYSRSENSEVTYDPEELVLGNQWGKFF